LQMRARSRSSVSECFSAFSRIYLF
jgi:hypothetical protein